MIAMKWREKIRKRLIKIIKRIVRSKVLSPLVVQYICFRIKPVNHHPNPELGVLVLDYERWWKEDLEELGKRVQLFVLPSNLRAIILSLFLTGSDMKQLVSYNFSGDSKKRKDMLIRYLVKLIPVLAKRKGFHCIVTTNHMYLQNKPIAESSSFTRVPFIDIYKECMKDEAVVDEFEKKYKALGINMNFMGNKICVYNTFMKNFFVNLGVAKPEKIVVTGPIRMDRFIQRMNQLDVSKHIYTAVVLFSFRHLPTCDNPREYVHHFSPDGTRGFVHLFDNVHCAFAQLALDNPHLDFVIKLKWRSVWVDYIKKALIKKGYHLDKIKNLRVVVNEETTQDLILKSIAVIGINSTTLLEARLAGRPVILPYFDEAAEKYVDKILFKSIFAEFCVVKSVNEFKSTLQKLIDSPPPFKTPSRELIEKYFGYNDGRSLDRVLDVLVSSCGNKHFKY